MERSRLRSTSLVTSPRGFSQASRLVIPLCSRSATTVWDPCAELAPFPVAGDSLYFLNAIALVPTGPIHRGSRRQPRRGRRGRGGPGPMAQRTVVDPALPHGAIADGAASPGLRPRQVASSGVGPAIRRGGVGQARTDAPALSIAPAASHVIRPAGPRSRRPVAHPGSRRPPPGRAVRPAGVLGRRQPRGEATAGKTAAEKTAAGKAAAGGAGGRESNPWPARPTLPDPARPWSGLPRLAARPLGPDPLACNLFARKPLAQRRPSPSLKPAACSRQGDPRSAPRARRCLGRRPAGAQSGRLRHHLFRVGRGCAPTRTGPESGRTVPSRGWKPGKKPARGQGRQRCQAR